MMMQGVLENLPVFVGAHTSAPVVIETLQACCWLEAWPLAQVIDLVGLPKPYETLSASTFIVLLDQVLNF